LTYVEMKMWNIFVVIGYENFRESFLIGKLY
jgi:hypothetical protein